MPNSRKNKGHKKNGSSIIISNSDPLFNGQTSAILPDDEIYDIIPYSRKRSRLPGEDLSASQRNSVID
jgi:hypothetical protein